MWGPSIDPLDGFEAEKDILLQALIRAGLVCENELKCGGETYTVKDGNCFQQGQIPEKDSFAVPVMEHNDWQVPKIAEDEDDWTAKIRFADGLKQFTDNTRQVGKLFEPFDMTRLGGAAPYVSSSYVQTVMDYVVEDCVVRDAPTWVTALAKKKGIRNIKISTMRPDRYTKVENDVVDESAVDIVLTSNLSTYSTAIFLSPAYYMMNRKIQLVWYLNEESIELRYWLKGKYQTKYLSRSAEVSYHVSKHGVDTLVDRASKQTSIEGSFTHSATDFFFFEKSDQRIRHLQFFQHVKQRLLDFSEVYRKSSVYNIYTPVLEGAWYLITDKPLPARIKAGNHGTIKWDNDVITAGKQFVYKVKTIGRYDVERKADNPIFNKRLQYIFDQRAKGLSDGAIEDEAFTAMTVAVEEFVPVPVCRLGYYDDYKEDLDPWEDFDEIDT